jgi:glycine/D-amino acid oxidase-like deaminating enzyme
LTQTTDVVVIGAGIVGAMTAFRLAEAGLRTTLLDADFAGGGSTGAAMGHLVVMDDSDAQFALTKYSRDRWNALADQLPRSAEHERAGTLWLAASDADLAVAASRATAYRAHGVAADVLTSAELQRAEPLLRSDLAGALRVPDDGVCYPPAIARWLCERAIELGATVRSGTSAVAIGDRTVTLHDGTALHAGAIVLAAGATAPQLLPQLPVIPRKGHLVITDRQAGAVRHQLVELGYLHSAHTFGAASVAFNVQPRITGQVLIGSSRELVQFDARINRSLVGAMLVRAFSFIPALQQARALRTWVGFRPATPDKLPLIGPWRAVPGLWIATGHEGLGITMATGTADLIVAGILERACPVDPTPFLPDRSMPAMAHAA